MAKELNFKQELVAAFGQPIAENPIQVTDGLAMLVGQGRIGIESGVDPDEQVMRSALEAVFA